MTPTYAKALLPAGLGDSLPPDAAFEVDVIERLVGSFAGHGYERVKPPLIEFEESFLAGSGAAMASQTFRLMDPVSQRMMGVRPDMTLQVARIAATRMRAAPRPLRLSYAGEVLRVRGTQLRPERQFGQVGVELIGSESSIADAEIILMAVAGLRRLGIKDLSVDMGLPTLVPAICRSLGLTPKAARRLRTALDRKDAAAVAGMEPELGAATGHLIALVNAAGPAEAALAAIDGLDLASAAAAERAALKAVVGIVREEAPDLMVTVDPVESRGFEYHTGVTFTFFARGVRGELGSGGRYLAGTEDAPEPATGFTLFTDSILRGLPRPKRAERVFVPADVAADRIAELQAAGWTTVRGLDAMADNEAEARRLRCSHLLDGSGCRELKAKREG